jgi:serine/threonine-protein kinase HipA
VAGDGGNQWSWHKASLAMAVWGKSRHYRMRDVKRAFQHGAALSLWFDAESIIDRLIERTPAAIETVSAALPAGFPSASPQNCSTVCVFPAQRLAE